MAGWPSRVAAVPVDPEASAAPSERALIEACQRGDRDAFDQIVARHQREVYRLCYRYVNDHHDASDLAQESFLKAWRALPRFRGDSALSTWLYRIAVNTCLSFREGRKPASDELPATLADSRPAASALMEADERARHVREAVARLPEKQRATLILKVYQELTHEEVAGILGTTVGTVKANLFHALSNLRKLVTADVARQG